MFDWIAVDADVERMKIVGVEDGEVGLSWVGDEVVVVEVVDEVAEF